ncbi:MAG: SDR family NAD(P)-dependent oxidoreductase [Proteobacteria bacterium]|nr:SDR family NAD(P)-dependent oxidoreductase [Pseudomonadota bacterium]
MKNNKTVLITGASSGIGYELAKLLAKERYDLILTARRLERLKHLKESIEATISDIKITIFSEDLSTEHAAEDLFKKIKQENLNLDILINNAGMGDLSYFSEANIETLSKMIHLNILSLTKLSRFFISDIKNSPAGAIINIASTASFQPVPLMAVYAATKAYVKSFSLALETELEEDKNNKAKIICICPGVTQTEFFANANANPLGLPEGFIASSEEVAKFTLKTIQQGKSGVAVHGKMNSALALLSRVLPANLSNAISLYIMKKLIRT